MNTQRGGTLLGLILGLILGLGAALAVAIYVTKVPVPFLSKGTMRSNDQEATEAEKNRDWNPNQMLQQGKRLAASEPTSPSPAPAPASATVEVMAPPVITVPAKDAPTKAAQTAASAAKEGKDAKASASADPLGDFAKARANAAPASSPAAATATADAYEYFVQVGAFRSQPEADAQRAKVAMLGWEARVSEREQNGRAVFRVRVGPFSKRSDAEQLKDKLDSASVDSTLVRVQR